MRFIRDVQLKDARKKVISEEGQYRCEKCNASYATCKNILMLQMEIADFSGTVWTILFEEKAASLVGYSADQLVQLRREDPLQYDAVFDNIRFHEFNMRVKVKYDMYNDQQQMRWSILDLKPIPYDKCKRLLTDAIQKCERLII